MKPSQLAKQEVQKTLVFGPPKSGKSAAVAQLSKHYNLLWLDGEKGAGVILNPELQLTPESLEHIELIQTSDTPSKPAYAEVMGKVAKFEKFRACNLHGKLNCVQCNKDALEFTEVDFSKLDDSWIIVVDSSTQLSNSVMNMIKLANGRMPSELVNDKATFNDYGLQGQWLDNFFAGIQACPYNVIVISHEMGIEQEDGKEKLTAVAGTRNFSRNLPRYFGHVVRMEVKNLKHTGVSSSTASNLILAGSRTGAKVEKTDNTTGESLLRCIYNSHTNYVRA